MVPGTENDTDPGIRNTGASKYDTAAGTAIIHLRTRAESWLRAAGSSPSPARRRMTASAADLSTEDQPGSMPAQGLPRFFKHK
jgi:hypothetical protein